MTREVNGPNRGSRVESTIGVGLSGRYRLVAVKADDTGERVLAEFDNLILDQGLDHLLTNTDEYNTVYDRVFSVGSGTTPESAEQTSLEAKIAHVNLGTGVAGRGVTLHGGNPYRVSISRSAQFSAGAAAGVISEVGCGWNTTSLFSRALVRDVNGNPTSVEVLSDEYLVVTYTLDVYIDVTDRAFTLNFPHGSHDGILRPADLGDTGSHMHGAWLSLGPLRKIETANNAVHGCIVSSAEVAAVTSRPSGVVARPAASNPAYVPGSFTDSVTLTYAPTVGNIGGGIRSLVVRFSRGMAYQMQFDPPVPKTSDHLFAITLRLTLGRM